jgi:hypothetical protein
VLFLCAQESVEHLFLACPFAKLVWRMVYFAFNLPPPTNITNLFGNWLNGVDKKAKERIRIGVSALCWSIWRCRNVEIILCLTNQILLIFCRYFIWLCTGCNNGRYYSPKTSECLWILDAPISRRSLRIFCSRLVGVTLVDYMMLSWLSFQELMFRWLIYVSTMSDP